MEEEDREIWVGENRVYLDEDNIINIIIMGEADEKMAKAIIDAENILLTMVEEKVNLLVDINKAEKVSLEGRKLIQKNLQQEKIGKIAQFGLSPVARIVASFVMGVTKKKDMRFFKSKQEALAWLKE